MNGLARTLRILSLAVALHGVLLVLAHALQTAVPDALSDAVGNVVFWVLAVPALFLAAPFMPLFWRLGLIDATGWFAWPKPLAIALAYAAWIAVLSWLGWLARRRAQRAPAKPAAH